MSKRWVFLACVAATSLATQAFAQPVQPAPVPAPLSKQAVSNRAIFNPYPAISPTPNAPPQYHPPTLSPYLGLLRGGDPAVNYYLEVVPALQKGRKELEPTIAPPRIDPKVDEEFKEMSLRRSTTGNLPSFGNTYGAYSLPNTRGYVPYNPPPQVKSGP